MAGYTCVHTRKVAAAARITLGDRPLGHTHVRTDIRRFLEKV